MIIDFKESAGNPEGVTLFDSPKFLDTLQKRRKILPNVQTTLYTQPSPTTVRGGRWLFFLHQIPKSSYETCNGRRIKSLGVY